MGPLREPGEVPSGRVITWSANGEEHAPGGVAPPFTFDEFLDPDPSTATVTRVERPKELKRLLFDERPARAPDE